MLVLGNSSVMWHCSEIKNNDCFVFVTLCSIETIRFTTVTKTADESLAFTIVDDMFRLIYRGLSIEEHATIAYCSQVTQ